MNKYSHGFPVGKKETVSSYETPFSINSVFLLNETIYQLSKEHIEVSAKEASKFLTDKENLEKDFVMMTNLYNEVCEELEARNPPKGNSIPLLLKD